MKLVQMLPWPVRLRLRRARNALALAADAQRWVAIASTRARRRGVAVSYGHHGLPAASGVVFGGMVKFVLLAECFPNAPRDFNILYLGSSSLPRDARMLARLARARGAPFVWNQNGVAYPGWHGPGWEEANRVPARLLQAADYALFQSSFCKLSADRFLGPRRGPWEILPNPVDTGRFRPGRGEGRPLTLLLGGSQYQRYPVEAALRTLAIVRGERPDVRLMIAGELSFAPEAAAIVGSLVRELELEDAVELTGPYTRADAPGLMQRADILLHPKINDPCPTVVLEAMACGVPVVYSTTGGTPELVGTEGGVGVPGPLDWEHDRPPLPKDLAAAVAMTAERLVDLRVSARERAVERFDVEPWVRRHRELFERLLAGSAG